MSTRMRKLIQLPLIWLMIALVSCSKDEPEPEKPLLNGEWKAIYLNEAIYVLPGNGPFGSGVYHFPDTVDIRLNVQSDNFFNLKSVSNTSSDPSINWSYDGNYSISGNKVDLTTFRGSSTPLFRS